MNTALSALLDHALEQQRLRPLDVAFARFLAERDARVAPALPWLAAVLSRQLADGHLCLDLELLPALAEEQDWPADWERVLLADNTLFSGQVIDDNPGEKAAAIRAFNAHARADERVELVMVPIADGLTMARRLPAGESRI